MATKLHKLKQKEKHTHKSDANKKTESQKPLEFQLLLKYF